ncbi:hypothetical protein D3H55_05050 [Bacillus salacetis]|uniref:Uncharacterized protein n=1 Tax=Bacillus salacetis TaxID=2315464 RepID=A0A3A1R4C4_9BACI|nr:hypothetical protein [Bacillus salacetis]RIW37404.1 hypothetical protein D3H55_05050 [Bacillus salacetis]
MKYIKPFLVCEWITIIGATTAAYFKLDLPLWICIGIVLLGVILTLYFSIKFEKESGGVVEK